MSVADQLGFGPKRETKMLPDGGMEVSVTAPAMFIPNAKTVKVTLRADQVAGYNAWRAGTHIQEALPDLTPTEREMLKTGLDDEDWDAMEAMTGEGDDHEEEGDQ